MRKRSRYKPRPIRLDTMQYVSAGFEKVTSRGDANIALRAKNHSAMHALAHGQATRNDLDTIIQALNMASAFANVDRKFGSDWREEITAAHKAFIEMARRGVDRGERFVCTGQELTAINLVMEIHDAQLDTARLLDLERAIDVVHKLVASGRTTPVLEAA